MSQDCIPLFWCTKGDCTFDHIGCILVLTELKQLTLDNFDCLCSVIWSALLNDMLNNIVSVLVWYQWSGASVKLFKNESLVLWFAELKNPLNDSTAIGVHCKNVGLSSEYLDDKTDVLNGDSLHGLLHYVVAILVFDTLKNVGLEFLD